MLKEYTAPDLPQDSGELKTALKSAQARLAAQQQLIREAKLPVILLVEGWAAAGKGTLINKLISEMDPRFCSLFSQDRVQEADRYPFLYPWFNAIPENGKFLFMDAGWAWDTVSRKVNGELNGEEYASRLESLRLFERTLRDNGYVLVKLFLHISEKEQRKRIEELLEDKDTAWRVSEDDLQQNKDYEQYFEEYDSFLEQNGDIFPWTVLDGSSKKGTYLQAFQTITQTVDAALAFGKVNAPAYEAEFPMTETPLLRDADLSACVPEKEYKKELKRLQKKLAKQHNKIYRRRIPVVIAYEGWDAAGKGGNIRRVAYPLDPRGFDVYPIASPEPHELARHYLWRFWERLPRSGHVAIFDRTWYGRVMVERLEGYCTENDWQRAYNEINEFERELANAGTVVLKFWIQIDPETQLQRFNDRQNTPEKQWKITEEDWRNRDKWPQYEEAISEMLAKTSTTYAPWHIIESVDKKYARLKVLRIITDALEAALEAAD